MVAPERVVRLGGQVLSLRANFRAFHDIEALTEAGYLHTVESFCKGSIRAFALFLWCLSASSRSEDRLPINFTEHDTAQGLRVPSEFLDLIPAPGSGEFYDLRHNVAQLLREAGLTEPEKKSIVQPAQPDSPL